MLYLRAQENCTVNITYGAEIFVYHASWFGLSSVQFFTVGLGAGGGVGILFNPSSGCLLTGIMSQGTRGLDPDRRNQTSDYYLIKAPAAAVLRYTEFVSDME